VILTVPATSANLGPGFDTLGLALNFRNIVKIKPSRFHSVSLKGEGANNPKIKDNNMFINIFNDFYKNLATSKDNFRFEFFNKIPMSRGLGSSSAVIVSAIASAYEVAKVPASKEKILNLALAYEPHPDNISPAVLGGFTVSTVNNNKVISIKKTVPNSIKAVVVIPNRAISTQQSRKTLPHKYRKDEAVFNLSRSSLLTGAFFNENWNLLKEASRDCFHQEYRMKGLPELFEVQDVALKNGALMSTLSGSGSTFLSLTFQDDAKSLKNKLQRIFPHYNILILDIDNNGLIIE